MLSPRLRDPLVAPESRLVELRELQRNVKRHEMETGLSYPIMSEIQEAIDLAEQEKVAKEESQETIEKEILEKLWANSSLHLARKYATALGYDKLGRMYIFCSSCRAGVYHWSLHERTGAHRDEIGELFFRNEARAREEVERVKKTKLEEEIRKVEAGIRYHQDMQRQSGKGLGV